MKKLIGLFGMVMIVASLFLNTSLETEAMNSNSVTLSSITTINTANAEGLGTNCNCNFWGRCKVTGSRGHCAGSSGNIQCQNYNGNC